MSKKQILQLISLLVNIAIFIITLLCFISYFTIGGGGNMEVAGFRILRYFTMDSNILVALTSLLLIPFNIINIKNNTDNIPVYADILKYVGTCSVMVTFLTVIFFLGPTLGYNLMYVGASLYMHGITPILALLSYILLESNEKKFINTIYSVLPVIIYGIVYIINVVVRSSWPDFYGFNVGGLWFISLPVMLVASYLIGLGVFYLGKLRIR